MKQAWFRSDWFAAVGFALLFAIAAYLVFDGFFQGLERTAYDTGVKLRSRTPSDRIAVIAIDDQSIQNLGRWPWPRTLHAQLIDKLRAGGAKVIVQAELSSEKIASILTHAMNDPEKLARMAAAAKQAGKPDAANLLAGMVEAIAAGRTIAEFKGAQS